MTKEPDGAYGHTCHTGWFATIHARRTFLPGPTFAGPYHAAGDPASAPLTYGRFHNPTWTAYEQALSELEGGPAVLFASGMAAVAAILGLSSVLAMSSCYPQTVTTRRGYSPRAISRRWASRYVWLPRLGILSNRRLPARSCSGWSPRVIRGWKSAILRSWPPLPMPRGRWSRWTTRRPPCWGSSPWLGAGFFHGV